MNYVLTEESARNSEFNRERREMQLNYVEKVKETYGGKVPIVILPLLATEVKGIDALNMLEKELFPC